MSTARIGVVLAGGRATRMGGDKAGALLGGVSLLERAVSTMAAAGLTPRVCARAATALPACGAPIWREPASDDAHPLAGLAWALALAEAPIVTMPVDLPIFPSAALRALAARPEPLVVVGARGRPAALVVRAAPEHAQALGMAAQSSAPAMRTLLALGAVVVDLAVLAPDVSDHVLLNVNDAADLARAETLLREHAAGGDSGGSLAP